MTMNFLSIQSWVSYGHVGNASAVFPLQRLGVDVWAVNTVQFSNHTGYGSWTGDAFTGTQITRLIDGIAARGVLGRCDAVLSGYMGDTGVVAAILDAVRRVKAENPAAIYCCDPVIGDDDTGNYVKPGIPELIRNEALRLADIATPNLYELRLLSGLPCDTDASLRQAIADLHAIGPRTVLVTSARTADTPKDRQDMLVSEDGHLHRLRTPLLDLDASGAGDAIAALFTFHRLRSGNAATAMAEAGSSIHGLLRRTAEAGSQEILTVAAQEEFVSPSERFWAEAV
jgi:pyridoxine kinase